ncbi:MAG: DUF4855 domain-containing protein [Clostridiales bacterium]|nr:DUF4855 domain-containing protein [Clostridiales bacterium]
MKKFYSLILITAIMLPLCFGSITVSSATPYIKGDASGNGVIDVSDYIAVRLYLLGLGTLSNEAKNAADADGNGTVGVTDYIYIRLHILGIIYLDENLTKQRVDNMFNGSADRSKNAVNALLGASYTYSTAPHDSYPDSDKTKLTDGQVSDNFDNTHWAGLYNQQTSEITFDMKKVVSGLTDLKVYSLRKTDYGIGLSPKMDLYISQNGEDYSYVSTVFTPADVPADDAFYYELRFQNTLSARYVKLVFEKAESVWFFINEVEFMVYEDIETSYYGAFRHEKITTPKNWNSSDSDYNTAKNMIKGLTYQIKPLSGLKDVHQTEYYNSPVSNRALTDGVSTASTNYQNQAYFHFTQAEGRFILFDLGALSTVTSFSGDFLKDTGTGINPPARIAVYVSEDGEKFGKAGEAKFNATASSQVFKATINFDKKYKARYVIVFLQISSHVWCSELEVYGTKKVQSDAVSPKAVDYMQDAKDGSMELGDKDGYLMPEDFMGVNNVLLSYHCLLENNLPSEKGLITVEEYLPHVGYYDTKGVLKDTFMDGFLYLPYTAFNYSDYAKTLEGWKTYLNNQFTANRNVDALNKAVGQVKTALNKNNYNVSVFFSILYTFKTLGSGKNNFGDVDGDGKNEDFNTLEGRKKAIKWIIDQQVSRFNSGNYNNLSLKGFYWFEESAGSDSQDSALIKYAADYLHTMGYVLFWIPWYRAQGFDKWEEFGFDAACMQPNYAFNSNLDISRLYDNAAYTKSLGMCVEFESNGTSYPAVNKIKEYLYVGIETGYMHAVKMYYQGGVPGDIYNAYKSKDPYVRSAYDEIYLYSKGRLTKDDFYSLNGTANPYLSKSEYTNGKFKGEIKADTQSSYKIKVATSPKYGTLKLNYNGTFEYTPFEGYKGTDSFTVYADYSLEKSAAITINININ